MPPVTPTSSSLRLTGLWTYSVKGITCSVTTQFSSYLGEESTSEGQQDLTNKVVVYQ